MGPALGSNHPHLVRDHDQMERGQNGIYRLDGALDHVDHPDRQHDAQRENHEVARQGNFSARGIHEFLIGDLPHLPLSDAQESREPVCEFHDADEEYDPAIAQSECKGESDQCRKAGCAEPDLNLRRSSEMLDPALDAIEVWRVDRAAETLLSSRSRRSMSSVESFITPPWTQATGRSFDPIQENLAGAPE